MRPFSVPPMMPVALAAVALSIAASPKALLAQSARPVQGDSASVAGVVERYDRALAAGDSAAALALLAPDAVILESGGVETREEYRSHHLASDIGFARTAQTARSPVRVVVVGDAAWATTTSSTQRTVDGRAVESTGAELMVLTRTPDGWQIRAIHWSSRTRRPR